MMARFTRVDHTVVRSLALGTINKYLILVPVPLSSRR